MAYNLNSTTCPPQIFEGNSDLYGIGVRLGFYAQVLSVHLSRNFTSSDSSGASTSTLWFMLALLATLTFRIIRSVPGDSIHPVEYQLVSLQIALLLPMRTIFWLSIQCFSFLASRISSASSAPNEPSMSQIPYDLVAKLKKRLGLGALEAAVNSFALELFEEITEPLARFLQNFVDLACADLMDQSAMSLFVGYCLALWMSCLNVWFWFAGLDRFLEMYYQITDEGACGGPQGYKPVSKWAFMFTRIHIDGRSFRGFHQVLTIYILAAFTAFPLQFIQLRIADRLTEERTSMHSHVESTHRLYTDIFRKWFMDMRKKSHHWFRAESFFAGLDSLLVSVASRKFQKGPDSSSTDNQNQRFEGNDGIFSAVSRRPSSTPTESTMENIAKQIASETYCFRHPRRFRMIKLLFNLIYLYYKQHPTEMEIILLWQLYCCKVLVWLSFIIAAIEYMIVWNDIQGISDVAQLGQIIALVMGVGSLVRTLKTVYLDFRAYWFRLDEEIEKARLAQTGSVPLSA